MPKFGSIVSVPFPFTDLSGAKVRPAVVISSKNMSDDIRLSYSCFKNCHSGKENNIGGDWRIIQ